jgi:hypothetical protein
VKIEIDDHRSFDGPLKGLRRPHATSTSPWRRGGNRGRKSASRKEGTEPREEEGIKERREPREQESIKGAF